MTLCQAHRSELVPEGFETGHGHIRICNEACFFWQQMEWSEPGWGPEEQSEDGGAEHTRGDGTSSLQRMPANPMGELAKPPFATPVQARTDYGYQQTLRYSYGLKDSLPKLFKRETVHLQRKIWWLNIKVKLSTIRWYEPSEVMQ